jgi:predicted nucleic acid-binding protein
MMAVRRAAAAATAAELDAAGNEVGVATDAELDELLRDADKQLAELQALLDQAAEQQFAVTTGTKVLAEMARQAQQRLDLVSTAADEMKLDEIAELLRRQSPARQRQLLTILEGGAE